MQPPPGYRDLELVGKGATSRVFRATSAKTNKTVALKRLHGQLLRTDDALARLRREFEALARIEHESIVRTYDVIRWRGDPTVVMDYVEGVGLEAHIRRSGRLGFEEVETIARSLLGALVAAHAAGIVHRDVKPHNVRIATDGRVFLLDFGSARFEAASELTQTGTTIGTPDYMAPELFAGPVYDPRVDIYGVGATLYECLSGVVPQTADSLTELAFKRTKHDVPSVQELVLDVPEGLGQLVDRCLARAPDERFASAALARWALDHPDPAIAFFRRRSTHPPCLHCDAKIDKSSTTCPECWSDHPFAYQPGSSHIVLKSVREPASLAGALATRFPERGTRQHETALADRIAALQLAPQRLLSFVDRDEAVRLADEFEQAGAQCEVIDDQGTSGWRLYTWCLFLFVIGMVVFGTTVLEASIGFRHAVLLAVPTMAALIGERVFAVVRGQQGLLSDSRYPVPLVEGARTTYAAAAAGLGGLAAFLPSIEGVLVAAQAPPAALAALPHLQLPLLVGAGVSTALFVGAWLMRLARSPVTKAGSPEPGLAQKIRRAFMLPRSFRERLRPEVAVILATSALALVPLELVTLDVVRAATESAATMIVPDLHMGDGISVVGPDAPGPSEWAPAPPSATPTAPAVEVTPQVPVPTAPSSPTPYTASAAILLVGLLLGRRMVRRARAVEEDGDEVLACLVEQRPMLSAPVRRAPRSPENLADEIANRHVPDGFLLAARARAADLARCLPDEESQRLGRAIDTIGRRLESGTLERSFLARAIKESDPEHRLRFELLNLEGRLEAQAAEAWFASLDEPEVTD